RSSPSSSSTSPRPDAPVVAPGSPRDWWRSPAACSRSPSRSSAARRPAGSSTAWSSSTRSASFSGSSSACRSSPWSGCRPGRAGGGEWWGRVRGGGLGGFLMASAGTLLMAYLSLEFVSLVSYVLTGFLRHNRRSGEAALKYLIYGGVASGTMIYGMSWVFGLTGSMDYAGIARGVAALDPASRPPLFLGPVLVLAG